jgi:hypothetical protein
LGGSLWIRSDLSARGDSLVIEKFTSGDRGLDVPQQSELALSTGATATGNPFSDPNYGYTAGTTTLQGGSGARSLVTSAPWRPQAIFCNWLAGWNDASSFGTSAQPLQSLASLHDSSARLS